MADMASLSSAVPTETALAVFGITAGVGGAAAQLLASRNLSSYPSDTIRLVRIAPAVLASIVATAAAGYLLIPGGPLS